MLCVDMHLTIQNMAIKQMYQDHCTVQGAYTTLFPFDQFACSYLANFDLQTLEQSAMLVALTS